MNPPNPPAYPLRPRNGGPLPKAAPKSGEWIYEPKVNGWRTLVHGPTGRMFNRKGEPLSIAGEFKPVLESLRQSEGVLDWLDCEAFERRHALGRGSLVILDAPLLGGDYEARQQIIYTELVQSGIAKSWPCLHEPPQENALLSMSYHFTDYGIPRPWTVEQERLPGFIDMLDELDGQFPGEDIDGIWAGWLRMQQVNKALGVELFEGYVAKRAGSLYPLQLRSPDLESPDWIKHRFV